MQLDWAAPSRFAGQRRFAHPMVGSDAPNCSRGGHTPQRRNGIVPAKFDSHQGEFSIPAVFLLIASLFAGRMTFAPQHDQYTNEHRPGASWKWTATRERDQCKP